MKNKLKTVLYMVFMVVVILGIAPTYVEANCGKENEYDYFVGDEVVLSENNYDGYEKLFYILCFQVFPYCRQGSLLLLPEQHSL